MLKLRHHQLPVLCGTNAATRMEHASPNREALQLQLLTKGSGCCAGFAACVNRLAPPAARAAWRQPAPGPRAPTRTLAASPQTAGLWPRTRCTGAFKMGVEHNTPGSTLCICSGVGRVGCISSIRTHASPDGQHACRHLRQRRLQLALGCHLVAQALPAGRSQRLDPHIAARQAQER